MLYPETTLELWKTRHGLIETIYECPKCKEKFKTTRPFITTGYVGLETPRHECGDRFVKAVLKPTSKSEIEFWLNLTNSKQP